MARVYNPAEPHACRLSASGEWEPDDLRPGALEVCDECGEAWVYDPIPWERRYRPLHPWPFDRKQRAALRKHRLGTDPTDEGDQHE